MKYPILIFLLFQSLFLLSQNNDNPTIAVCNGNQYVCATGLMSQICVNIVVNPNYPNINFIDHFEIRWGDGSPNTNVPGSPNPPSQQHTYDLTNFYGTCTPYQEFDIKLLTHHTNGALPANNSFTLTFINPPIAGINISDQLVCLGQSTTISDGSCPTAGLINSNWNFGDNTFLNDTLSSVHTYTAAGTYTITHSIANSCGSDNATSTVTVLNLPVADIQIDSGALSGSPPVVCLGGGGIVKFDASISLNETSYMWSVSPASGWQWWPIPGITPFGSFARIRFTQAGTYTIKVIVNNDCNMPSEKTLVIKVVDAPQLNLNPQADGCLGISYTPTPTTTGATYTINGVVHSSFPAMLGLSPTPYIVEATLTNECGTQVRRDTFSLEAAQTVMINTPASNQTVCAGDPPITLSATPTGGAWTGQHISQSGGNTIFTPPTTSGVFTLTYTRGSGACARSADVVITVEQAYNLQLNPQEIGCVTLDYSPSPLDANVQYTINGVPQNTFPVPLAVSNNPYIIEASITTVCGLKTLTDTFLVVAPVAVNIQLPAQDTLICMSTDPLSLQANPTGGTWSGTGISGPVGNQVFTPSMSGTFELIYSRGVNDCERSDTVKIIVEKPYGLVLNEQVDDCISLNYSPSPYDANITYTLNGTVTTQFPQTLQEATAPYIVTATHMNVCGTEMETDTFFILTPTDVHILAPFDTIVCLNSGALTLSAEPAGGTWMGQNISGSVFNPSNGGIFPLIYSRGTGNCEKLDTTVIEVIAIDIEAGDNLSTCIQDPAFLLSNFNPPTGGEWTGAGITNVAGNFDPAIAGIGQNVLYYGVIAPVMGSVLECVFRDSIIVDVHPMPESNFPPPLATCVNEEIEFENLSLSTYEVKWDFGDGITSTMTQPKHTYTDTGTYTITLMTTNEFGCFDMMSQTIFVTEPPHAFFTPMPDSGCAVLPVFFNNESYGWETTYQWSFGNLQTDSVFTPGPVLLPGGTKDTFYIVTLSATNLCAVRTWTDSVLVYPLPLANFGTTTDTVCNGATLLFANTTLGQPESFSWDFGNGLVSTDSLPNPVQYFTDSLYRTYTIRLIATNFCGIDTFEHDITVKPVDVKAFFNVPNLEGCQPFSVQFSNFATPGATVSWDFGDGNTSALFNPQHTYLDPGIFKVVQKATSGCGFDSTIANITVLPAPSVSFSALPQICRDANLSFSNTSTSVLSGLHWDFGDGDSSKLNNPSHPFSSAGIHVVTLTGISADNGCPASFSSPINVLELPIVDFSVDKQDGCVPLTIAFQIPPQGATYFEWDFSDGNTASGSLATHTFVDSGKYEVKLLGIDLNGCRNDTILRYITAHPIPTPAFDMQRDILCGLPVEVDFINNTTDAIGYSWIFGDGTGNSTFNNPHHTYTLPGDYAVQLIAENTFLCKDTAIQTFSAYAQPIADFTWNPENGCSPLTVTFENLSSYTTGASWHFSDGSQSKILEKPVHTFYDWGTHGVTLIASHRDVCFDTLALNNIIEVYQSPIANFSFVETITDPPSGMFEFTDLSVGAISWQWDFGDGGSASVPNPSHRYYSNGPKEVRLTVWSENDCPHDTILILTPSPMHGLFIPNAFTPGLSNGEAALFQPKGVGLIEFEIAVYSSYGQLVWTSGTEELVDGQPGRGWDGTINNNTPMPQDVYTWQVKRAVFDDGVTWEGKRIGSVTLIR